MRMITLIAGFVAFAAIAQAEDYKVGTLQIGHPWARATPKGASVGGGYLTITNTGTTSDRLIGGSTPIAERFEIHEMKMDNGVMRMRQMKDGLEIQPGQTVVLKPGAFHIMLVNLKQPIKLNDTVKGTLTFEKAGSVDVEFAVVPVGAMPNASTGDSMGSGSMGPMGNGAMGAHGNAMGSPQR